MARAAGFRFARRRASEDRTAPVVIRLAVGMRAGEFHSAAW
jgi:hypothetical protein